MKENLIETIRCNEGWEKVNDAVAKHEQRKEVLKDIYKKAEYINDKPGAFPNFPHFYNDFSKVLGTRNISSNVDEVIRAISILFISFTKRFHTHKKHGTHINE